MGKKAIKLMLIGDSG